MTAAELGSERIALSIIDLASFASWSGSSGDCPSCSIDSSSTCSATSRAELTAIRSPGPVRGSWFFPRQPSRPATAPRTGRVRRRRRRRPPSGNLPHRRCRSFPRTRDARSKVLFPRSGTTFQPIHPRSEGHHRGMRTRRAPLLAELHAHTTWSDGTLGIPELVDLAGVRGSDLLCITDHVVRDDDPVALAVRARHDGRSARELRAVS